MPAEALIASALQSKTDGIKNVLGQILTTADNRRYGRKQYEQQKRDALEFWHMQNAYNSPEAQMQRYKAAGLNPNLIYGQQNTGGSISTPDFKAAPGVAPRFNTADMIPALSSIYDIEIKRQQVNNMKAQFDVIQEEAALKAAQQRAVLANAGKSEFDLAFESEFRDISADMRRETLRKLRTETDISINRDAREALMNTSNLKEAVERMATMRIGRAKTRQEIQHIREAVNNMKKEGVLDDMEIELKKQGLTYSDPVYYRVAGRMLSDLFGSEGMNNTSGNIFRDMLPEGTKAWDSALNEWQTILRSLKNFKF